MLLRNPVNTSSTNKYLLIVESHQLSWTHHNRRRQKSIQCCSTPHRTIHYQFCMVLWHYIRAIPYPEMFRI